MWPDRRLLDLIGTELPVIQAPMAGANGSAMAIAVSEAGGPGAVPIAKPGKAQTRSEIGLHTGSTGKQVNANFFCHKQAEADPEREAGWRHGVDAV